MSTMNEVSSARGEPGRAGILLALMIGGAISLLSETIVNVALASFMKEFGVSANAVQWLTTGYMLIIGILVPISAFLLEWLSTRMVFLASLVIFCLGTIIAGAATSFPMLLIGRLIQAVGTGPMVPLMINTTLLVTPREKHGSALGLCQLVILMAPAVAPTLAGALLQFVSWRWLFFFVLPFALIAGLVALRFLKVPRVLTKPKVDLPSILLSTVGFGSLIYGVSEVGGSGMAAALPYLAVGLIVLALFVWRELAIPNPMLDLKAFGLGQFSLGMVLVIVLMMGFFASMLMIPLYLEEVLAVSPLITGLLMLPGGIVNGIGAPLSGRIYDRSGPRLTVILGILCAALGLGGLAFAVSHSAAALLTIALYTLEMLGLPYAMTPIQTNSLSSLSRESYAHGTAIMNTLQMLAASLGSSLFIGIMSAKEAAELASGKAQNLALQSGLSLAFAVAAALMLLALLAAILGIRRRAAAHS